MIACTGNRICTRGVRRAGLPPPTDHTNGSVAVSWKGLSQNARKRVELAVAVSQEKLLAAHVDHALDLIALVDRQVNFTDALEIYARLLRLDEDEARNISTRTLAILGEKAVHQSDWVAPEPPPPPEPEENAEPTRSVFGQLRHRLRGRVNEDLRRRIEFIAARTEVSLLDTHVENALHFVDFLDSEVNERQAVDLYLDALDVRDAIAEVVYYLTLARLADDLLPPHGAGLASIQDRSGSDARDTDAPGRTTPSGTPPPA
jgi:PAS domain-containing protein